LKEKRIKELTPEELKRIGNRSFIRKRESEQQWTEELVNKFKSRQVSRRDVLKTLGLVGVGLGAGMLADGEVFAQVPSGLPTTVEPGSLVTEASQIVFKDADGFIYREDGYTGKIEEKGTDASTVILNAINALGTAGGMVWLKDIYLPSTVSIPSNVLVIESKNGYLYFIGSLITKPSVSSLPFDYKYKPNYSLYELIDGFEDLSGWSGTNRAADTVNYMQGLQGMKLTSTNGVTQNTDKTVSLNLQKRHFAISIYIDNINNLQDIYIMFEVANSNWGKYFTYPIPTYLLVSGWNTIDISRAQFGKSGGAVDSDWVNITKIRLRATSKPNTTVSVTWDDFNSVKDLGSGKVTFSFDDGFADTWNAKAVLDKYGYRANLFVVKNWVGTSGYLSLTQLKQLYERGWDIGSHSVSHSHLSSLTDAQKEYELRESQRFLVENGFLRGARFFAAPYHEMDSTLLDLAKKYYQIVRWGTTAMQSLPPASWHQLRGWNIYNFDLTTMKSKIDWAKANNAWICLHLYGNYTWLSDLVDYIHSQKLEVVTYSDILDALTKESMNLKDTNSGTATFSGDGTTKVFNVSYHGLAVNPTDRTRIKACATPQSTDAENASPISAYPVDLNSDGAYEGLKIVFASAPVSGTDNVKLTWYAELD